MRVNIEFIIITFEIELNSIWEVEISIIRRLFKIFEILLIAEKEVFSLLLFNRRDYEFFL